MNDLADLVDLIVQREGLQVPESGVLDKLTAFENEFLSKVTKHFEKPAESRISRYAEALKEYRQGLVSGLDHEGSGINQSVESCLSGLGNSLSVHYILGFTAGYALNITVKDGNTTVANSYFKLASELRNWTELLVKELERLRAANRDPFEFLMNNLPTLGEANFLMRQGDFYRDTRENLKRILAQYKSFTEDLLMGNVSEEQISQLKQRNDLDANVQVGIYYLIHGRWEEAGQKFKAAGDQGNNFDGPLLHQLGNNANLAEKMLKPVYRTVEVARKFEQRLAPAA